MISERTNTQGITFLDIDTEACKATLCRQGAHMTSWIPKGHKECLFTSSKAYYAQNTAIRGGIPLCWPWFGKKENAPAHGIARTSDWQIDHYGVDPESGVASIHLRFYPDDDQLPVALLRITIADELNMRLQTTARKAECCLTTAFHNYLRVGKIDECKISNLGQYPFEEFGVYHEKTGRPFLPLLGGDAIDRIYRSEEPIPSLSLEDQSLKRRITILAENVYSAVVWNPGHEGANSIADLGDGEWKEFACIEPAVTAPFPLKLCPGQTHIMRQTIRVQHL